MQTDSALIRFMADVGKAVGIAVLVSLGGVLLFALVIYLAALPSSVITPVNQIIKVIAIFLGCVLGFRPEQGIAKGAVAGLLSIILTYLIFAFLSGGVTFSVTAILELVFGGIIGAISGIISVNLRK